MSSTPTADPNAALRASANLCEVIVNIIGALCNSILITVILKTPSYRNAKSQLMVVGLAAVDISYNLTRAGMSSNTFLNYAYQLPQRPMTQLQCLHQSLAWHITGSSVLNMMVMLSMDRFICLAFPIFYFKRRLINYVSVLVGASIGHAIVDSLIHYIGATSDHMIYVCLWEAESEWYGYLNFVQGIGRVSLCVIFYLLALIILMKRLKGITNLPETQRREERRKMELGTFRTILVFLICYVMSDVLTSYALPIIARISMEILIKIAPFVGVLFGSISVTHLFIYLIMSKEFRGAFRLMVASKNQSVQLPSSSNVIAIRIPNNTVQVSCSGRH